MRRLTTAAAITAVLLGIAGCGSQQADQTGNGTTGTGGSNIRELSASNFGSAMAQAQSDAHSVHMAGVVTNAGTTLHINGDVAVGTSLEDLAMSMTMKAGPGKTITMIFVDRAIYLKASGTGLTHSSAKPWVKVDLDDPTNPFGAMLDQMFASLDPDRVQKIYSAISRLNDLGIDEVDGVQARHYTVTVDTDRMIHVMGMDKFPGVTTAQLKAQLPDEITSQVWLDADNRPIKTRSAQSGMVSEMTFSRWGEKVTVKAPPAQQVMPFSQVSR